MTAKLNKLPAKQVLTLKVVIFLAALLPLGRLIWLGWNDRLGANPVEFITRSTGTWTLIFLCITLAVTPLRKITGWNILARFRRMLGLFAFFYVLLHFTTYIWLDQWFAFIAIGKDVLKRPFITVGFMAFVLLWPLALTSTNSMMRRLGGQRWQKLHRLIYLISILGVLHFWWHKAGKNDFTEPAWYALVVVLLLGYRLIRAIMQHRDLPQNMSRAIK